MDVCTVLFFTEYHGISRKSRLRCMKSVLSSNQRATLNSRCSWKLCPMNCKPIGRPRGDNAAGTVIAGIPVTKQFTVQYL